LKLLREPLIHFMLIGACIYLLYGFFSEPVVQEDDKTIIVTAGEVEWMQASWLKRWNRPPTAEEFKGLLQQYIKETVLYREALTMGLNKHDMVIRRRLAQKLEFLAKDLVSLTPPSTEDLQTYFEQHRERYQKPVRYTFTQVFIDPDKRDDKTLDDAEAIKNKLIAEGIIDNAGNLGDDFMLQNYYPEKEPMEIQKLFGSGFVESLQKLSAEQWHGPVLSGYGVHLVYINSIIEPAATKFDEVRERVQQDWSADRGNELNDQFYKNLREQYTVIIEELEAEQ